MAKAKIEQYFEVPGVTAERFGKVDVRIRYTIDGRGPYEVTLPKEKFTPSTAEEAVKLAAKERATIEGKEFVL